MCGIIGYIGHGAATPVLLEGLRRLEYRGYDSVGIATIPEEGQLCVVKTPGRVERLAQLLGPHPRPSRVGIGHSRWATHGPATAANAHPHVGGDQELAVVHNGVIENHDVLRQRLLAAGYHFHSATDTEVAAQLIHWHVQQSLAAAGTEVCLELQEQHQLRARIRGVHAALDELEGSYALVILFRDMPQLLLAARRSSPLVIGVADEGHLIGSDMQAISQHARRWARLNDNELAVVRADSVQILKADFSEATPHLQTCVDDADDSDELGEFPHFTLKEIYAQPTTLRRVLETREQLSGAMRTSPEDRGLPCDTRPNCPDHILIAACGTSWHASLFGKYIIEELAGIPVTIEYASEFRYRVSPRQPGTLFIAVSQSGETADTVGALRDFQACGQATLAICNVPRSTLAQEADGALFLHVSTELGVAATKSYTAQCAVFVRLAIELAQRKACLNGHAKPLTEALARLPDLIEQVLECDAQIQQLAERFCDSPRFLFVGRGYELPTALEGALKLKEISYIHAEGYAAGELKHGPLALVDENTPTVALATPGRAYEKMLSNLQEIRARGGAVSAVGKVQLAGSDAAAATFLTDTLPSMQKLINVNLREYSAITNNALAGGRTALKPEALTLTMASDVRVYFVGEGASYHNTVGFNSSAAGVTGGDPLLIFPDASSPNSYLSSGGTQRTLSEPLMPGDFVNLGSFQAGTLLDFFLIANGAGGWNTVFSTDSKLNGDQLNHAVTFAQAGSPYMLIGFEDMVGGGDRDYNDALFAVYFGGTQCPNTAEDGCLARPAGA